MTVFASSKHQNYVSGTSLSTLLSLKEMAVIRQIQDNPNISITIIAANTRLSKSTIDRVIRALKEKGSLTRIGAKNNATWLITRVRDKNYRKSGRSGNKSFPAYPIVVYMWNENVAMTDLKQILL